MNDALIIVDNQARRRQVLARFAQKAGRNPVALDNAAEIADHHALIERANIAFVHEGLLADAAMELRFSNPGIVIVGLTSGPEQNAFPRMQEADLFAPETMPFAQFQYLLASAERFAAERRLSAERSALRVSLVHWYHERLRRLTHGEPTDLRSDLRHVAERLARLFSATGVTVITAPKGLSDWRVAADSLLGSRVDGLPVLDGEALFRSLVELRTPQLFAGDELPMTGEPFDAWRRFHLCFFGQPLPIYGGAVIWVLRRAPGQPEFQPAELRLFAEIDALADVLLDSLIGMRRLLHRVGETSGDGVAPNPT